MSDDVKKDVTLSLNVLIHKEKAKVLFAEADSHFVDILLSFLTLPLGRIIKVLNNHYGDEAEAATFGSLSCLYRSLANLDSSHFVTKGAKQTLLNPTSSFEAEYEKLKLDVSDSPPAEYFYCTNLDHREFRFRCVSTYYDEINYCHKCRCFGMMSKKVVPKKIQGAASIDGVFTLHKDSFIISDDLRILPNETGILGFISILGIADMDEAEIIKVDLGLSEITKLLKASLTSPTPLSDLIMNKTQEMNINSRMMESAQSNISSPEIAREENPKSRKLSLKVMIQKSSGKFLYAQANQEFVEFLFSCLNIPLGGVEHLLSGKACVTAIDNLYRSTLDVIDDKYFNTNTMKERLTKPNVVHGCISKHHILPLVEEPLPFAYYDGCYFSTSKFYKGPGRYLEGPRTYQVKDDLTVVPFCTVSILSGLRAKRISISDVEEVEMQIGLKEACSILKASLTSTTALTDALLSGKSFEQPQREDEVSV